MVDSAKEEKPVCTFFKKKVKQRQQRRRRESSDEEGSEVIFPAKYLGITISDNVSTHKFRTVSKFKTRLDKFLMPDRSNLAEIY